MKKIIPIWILVTLAATFVNAKPVMALKNPITISISMMLERSSTIPGLMEIFNELTATRPVLSLISPVDKVLMIQEIESKRTTLSSGFTRLVAALFRISHYLYI